MADHAHRLAERQWHKQQAEAGLAAFDWFQKNPEASFLATPPEVRDWLAPDQWQGLETLAIDGRLKTGSDLFERLDRQMVYEPEAFATLDLDRHRLSLGDADYARFADAQKATAEGTPDPATIRYSRARLDADRALEANGLDTDGPDAHVVRANIRSRLGGFEAIEGRSPNGADIAAIAEREGQRGLRGPSADRLDTKDKPPELQLAGDNQRQNKQARDIAVKLKLTDDQAQQLHRAISGQGLSYQEVLQIAIDMFSK